MSVQNIRIKRSSRHMFCNLFTQIYLFFRLISTIIGYIYSMFSTGYPRTGSDIYQKILRLWSSLCADSHHRSRCRIHSTSCYCEQNIFFLIKKDRETSFICLFFQSIFTNQWFCLMVQGTKYIYHLLRSSGTADTTTIFIA